MCYDINVINHVLNIVTIKSMKRIFSVHCTLYSVQCIIW